MGRPAEAAEDRQHGDDRRMRRDDMRSGPEAWRQRRSRSGESSGYAEQLISICPTGAHIRGRCPSVWEWNGDVTVLITVLVLVLIFQENLFFHFAATHSAAARFLSSLFSRYASDGVVGACPRRTTSRTPPHGSWSTCRALSGADDALARAATTPKNKTPPKPPPNTKDNM